MNSRWIRNAVPRQGVSLVPAPFLQVEPQVPHGRELGRGAGTLGLLTCPIARFRRPTRQRGTDDTPAPLPAFTGHGRRLLSRSSSPSEASATRPRRSGAARSGTTPSAPRTSATAPSGARTCGATRLRPKQIKDPERYHEVGSAGQPPSRTARSTSPPPRPAGTSRGRLPQGQRGLRAPEGHGRAMPRPTARGSGGDLHAAPRLPAAPHPGHRHDRQHQHRRSCTSTPTATSRWAAHPRPGQLRARLDHVPGRRRPGGAGRLFDRDDSEPALTVRPPRLSSGAAAACAPVRRSRPGTRRCRSRTWRPPARAFPAPRAGRPPPRPRARGR